MKYRHGSVSILLTAWRIKNKTKQKKNREDHAT